MFLDAGQSLTVPERKHSLGYGKHTCIMTSLLRVVDVTLLPPSEIKPKTNVSIYLKPKALAIKASSCFYEIVTI